jgi:ADP-ribose pyrophosphatase YjhB (NUDIX family)
VTLRRKIAEETGLVVAHIGPWYSFRFSLTEDSHGNKIDFVHTGVWTSASAVLGRTPLQTISADTAGAVWIEDSAWRQRKDLSALVREVLAASERLRSAST